MLTMFRTIGATGVGAGTSVVPWKEWGHFLEEFHKAHKGWLTLFETTDHETRESARTGESVLESIVFDTEDELHPRINVTVRNGNKIFKHILYMPSRVVWHTSDGGLREALEIETVNTTTVARFRPQSGPLPAI